ARRNLIVIFISNFVASTGMAGFLPAFPIILPKLGIVDSSEVAIWTGVLVGAAPFSAAITGPLWGAFGDRYGRKMMVLRALGGLSVFVGLMAFVSDPWILLILRLAQGTFSGFIAPSLTLVSVHTPANRQGFVASVLQAAMLAGGAVGPPLGGWILDHGSPSYLFGIAAFAALISMILVIFYTREEVKPAPVAVRVGPLRATSRAWSDVKITLANPLVWKLLAALFIIRFGVSSVEPLFAFYVESFKDTSAFVATYLGLANGVIISATQYGNLLALPAWGRAGDKSGYKKLLILSAAGAGLFYLPQAFAPGLVSLFILRFFSGVFLAGIIPSAYGMMAEGTPVERRGSSYSLIFSATALANSFGPVAGGLIVAQGISVQPLLIASAIPMLLAAFWIARWGRAEKL
ncbi:MAG: MFS transporter, partial [Planctomycetota bacterium]